MLFALLLSCLPSDLRVEGLAPGERARALPSVARPALAETTRSGRVLDAFTGRPVAGASIETWTEEVSSVGQGLRRVGEARSGEGGQFCVRVRDGGLVAEKIRVRAPGYLTCPGTVPDLERVLLFPAADDAPGLRVVDLQGQPIAAACITTTYSCAHDVTAFQVCTDAFGMARLSEYGLQDRIGDLRVRAPGFEAVKTLDWTCVLGPPEDGLATIVLPRRPVLRVRWVDAGGAPLALRPLLVLDGDGYHVPFSDEGGRCILAERYDGAEVTVHTLAPPHDEFLYAGALLEDGETTVRAGGRWDAREVATGRLCFRVRGLGDGARLPLELFHEDGWTASVRPGDEAPIEFPAGHLRARFGQRFGGWEVQTFDLDLAADEERTVEVEAVREPVLEVRTPPGEELELLVECAGDSTRCFAADDGVTPFAVPSGAPLTVVAWGARSHRARLEGLSGDGVLDLTGDETLVRDLGAGPQVELAGRPRGALDVRIVAPDGAPLACALDVTVRGEHAVQELDAGVFRIEATEGEPLLVRSSAPGFADAGARGRVGQDAGIELTPLPLAAIAIEAPFAFMLAPPFEDGLDALHPGPLELTLLLADGRSLALALALEPGEWRRLTIHE